MKHIYIIIQLLFFAIVSIELKAQVKIQEFEFKSDYSLNLKQNLKNGFQKIYGINIKDLQNEKFILRSDKINIDFLNPCKLAFIDTAEKKVIPLKFESIFFINENLLCVKLNGKWGALDSNANEVIPMIYEAPIWYLNNDLIGVKFNGKYGFINLTNKNVIPIVFDDVHLLHRFPLAISPLFGLNGAYNLMYTINNIADSILIIAKSNGKEGILDKYGKVVLPFIYDEISLFNQNLIKVKLNGKVEILDKKGRAYLPFTFYDIAPLNENLFSVFNGKYGVLDKTGKIILPLKYGYISQINQKLIQAYLNRREGVFDKSGKIILPFEQISVGSLNEKLLWSRTINGKMLLFDNLGKKVITMEFDGFENIFTSLGTNNLGLFVIKDKKWGYVNKSGKLLTPIKYDKITLVEQDSIFIFQSENKYGIFDRNGKELTNVKYEKIQPFFSYSTLDRRHGFFIFLKDNKWGVIDKSGNEIISNKYDRIRYCYWSDSSFNVELNNKWGVIDKTGNYIVPINYDKEIEYSSNGLTVVKLHNKFGVIDRFGTVKIPIIYDRFNYLNKSGLAQVELNNKWGVIDDLGKEVISIKYDYIDFKSNDEIFKIILNGKTGIIDIKGKELIPNKYNFIDGFRDGWTIGGIADKYYFLFISKN